MQKFCWKMHLGMAPVEKLGSRSGHSGKVSYDVVALERPADHTASPRAGVAFYDCPTLEKESRVFEP